MNKSKKYKYFRKNRCDKNSKHETRKIQRGGQPYGSTLVSNPDSLPIASGNPIIPSTRELKSLTGEPRDIDYKKRNQELRKKNLAEQAKKEEIERIAEEEYQETIRKKNAASALAAQGQKPEEAATAAPALAAQGKTPTPTLTLGETSSTQAILHKEAEERRLAAEKEQLRIEKEVEDLNKDAINRTKQLTKELDNTNDDQERQKISFEIDAIRENLFEQLQDYHNRFTGDNIPYGIKLVGDLLKMPINWVEEKMREFEVGTKVANAKLTIVDNISDNLEKMNQEGEPLHPDNAIKTEIALKIASGAITKPENPVIPDTWPKAGGIPPGGVAEVKKALEGVAGAAGAVEAAEAVEEKGDELLPNPIAEEEEEGEGGDGQGGGGISRKRSHSKYMNQVSENRNKIFKKELEIINSIRRFHRSHTIRKRDKISSILGLRKSMNSKNRNHGNTKHTRRHRHNKHKSAKHIKK
jgi:hypothetical protein